MITLELPKSLQALKTSPPTPHEQQYLLGFRGLLVIEAFLWVFLQTFVPVAVYASADSSGKLYQEVLRNTLSVLFWNEYFLYGSIIFLSARSIAIPFLRNPDKERMARSILSRGLALWFPVAISLAIIKLSFSSSFLNLVSQFKTGTGNSSLQVPYHLPSTLAYWNSVFNIFWTTHTFAAQAGSTAFPSQTLWMVTAVYIQSYTVYMTMIIIPYTRAKWRVQGAFFFVLTAWWCQSWAWCTISGLCLCDMVMNMDFKARARRGIPIPLPRNIIPTAIRKKLRRGSHGDEGKAKQPKQYRLPLWLPAGLLLTAGLLMQYLWVAWRPEDFNEEYMYHSGLYYTAGLNYQFTTHHTPARDDAYLMVVGIFVFLETYDSIQRFFENAFLVALGRRSLSEFFYIHLHVHAHL
jgi:hypothetical protein